LSQRPNLSQLIQSERSPFLRQQKYDALVSVIPSAEGWKTCQRIWLFAVTTQPTGKRDGSITVGAKFAMYKYGLPETGIRLSVPSEDPRLLKPIISIAVPAQMLSVVGDGIADFYTSYTGRPTDKLSEIADLLEQRFDSLSDG
jgi:hypothetical protein